MQSSPIIPASGKYPPHTMAFNSTPLAALEIQKAPFRILTIAEPEEVAQGKGDEYLIRLSTLLYWNLYHGCIRPNMSHTFLPSTLQISHSSKGQTLELRRILVIKTKSVCIVSWHRWLFLDSLLGIYIILHVVGISRGYE